MSNLNKYLALFMLVNNRGDLEGGMEIELDRCSDNLSDKDKEIIKDVHDSDITDVYWTYEGTGVVELDAIMHKLHLEDTTLRDKVNFIINLVDGEYIKFDTQIREHYLEDIKQKEVLELLKSKNIGWKGLTISITWMHDHINRVDGLIYEFVTVQFICTGDNAEDYKRIDLLKELFPKGETMLG